MISELEKIESISRGKSNIEVAFWHMENSQLKGATWAIALCIAMHHNKEYGYSFPTIERLTEILPHDRRTITRAIREMKDSGEWIIASGRGGIKAKEMGITARANRYYPRFQSRGQDAPSVENTQGAPRPLIIPSEGAPRPLSLDSEGAPRPVSHRLRGREALTKVTTTLKLSTFPQNNFHDPLGSTIVPGAEKISVAAAAERESFPEEESEKDLAVSVEPLEKTKTSQSATAVKKLHAIENKNSAIQFATLLPEPLSLKLIAEINKSSRSVNRLNRALETVGAEGQKLAIKNSQILVGSGQTIASVIGWLETWGLINDPTRQKSVPASRKFSTQLGNEKVVVNPVEEDKHSKDW